ncbi:MAG: HAD hydrolase-like protein [Lachnospiraceae bacterium]|nr:HAD hydrolase-like protein [Lachnospiraceae bacterium]
MFKYLLFDLDGTLTESGSGIMNAARFALDHYGIRDVSEEELRRFIGPPLKDSFMRFYGFDEDTATEAIVWFRKYYNTQGWCENSPYPGVIDMLKELKESKFTLIVATSKIEVQAVRICSHFGLDCYLDGIVGSDDGARSKKSDVIRYVLKEYGVDDLSEAIMIGDREHDIFGAKDAGLKSMGVLYGYGDREELEKAGADIIAERVEDISKFFCNIRY